ncbi:PvpA [Citreicella sp. SE45]|nr:PvpA [Citreicella sp. SE45]
MPHGPGTGPRPSARDPVPEPHGPGTGPQGPENTALAP